jgi:hypothetical protein
MPKDCSARLASEVGIESLKKHISYAAGLRGCRKNATAKWERAVNHIFL